MLDNAEIIKALRRRKEMKGKKGFWSAVQEKVSHTAFKWLTGREGSTQIQPKHKRSHGMKRGSQIQEER